MPSLTPIQTDKATLIAVNISGTSNHYINDGNLYYMDKSVLSFMPLFEVLPLGQWQILGMSNEITEEQAAELVEINTNCDLKYNVYIDYENGGKTTTVNGCRSTVIGFDEPGLSVASLLRANGILSPVLLLKKIETDK